MLTVRQRWCMLRLVLRGVFSWRPYALWLGERLHVWACVSPGCGVTANSSGAHVWAYMRVTLTPGEYVALDAVRSGLRKGEGTVPWGTAEGTIDFIDDLCADIDEGRRLVLRERLGRE